MSSSRPYASVPDERLESLKAELLLPRAGAGENVKVAATLVCIFIGLGGILSLFDKANNWEIGALVLGIAGFVMARKHDREIAARWEMVAEINHEQQLRESATPSSSSLLAR